MSLKQEIVRLHREGISTREIADKLECTTSWVRTTLRRSGVALQNKHVDRDRLLELHGLGWKKTDIGRELGCDHATVLRVLRSVGEIRKKTPVGGDGSTDEVRLKNLLEINSETGCWEYQGFTNNGYGQIALANGTKTVSTHRLAYELFVGEIPDGLSVLHRCDVRKCCNPEHLFLGTHTDNMRDMASKRRASTKGSEATRKVGKGELEQILSLRESGLTAEEIASTLSISQTSVSRYLAKSGKPAMSTRKGLISEQQLAEMKSLKDQGASYAEIGRRYGKSRGGVHRALKRLEN